MRRRAQLAFCKWPKRLHRKWQHAGSAQCCQVKCLARAQVWNGADDPEGDLAVASAGYDVATACAAPSVRAWDDAITRRSFGATALLPRGEQNARDTSLRSFRSFRRER